MNDTATPTLPPPLDREQGIIAFNRRVLALAESPNAPLLERLRYITIVSSNLDELFEIRVAELKEIASSNTPLAATARTSIATLAVSARELVERQYQVLRGDILPALEAEGVKIFFPAQWDDALRNWAYQVFMSEVEPLLTPIALDPAHPFPRISSKTLNFAVELDGRDAFGRRPGLAIVQAPRVLPIAFKVPPEVAGVPHGLHERAVPRAYRLHAVLVPPHPQQRPVRGRGRNDQPAQRPQRRAGPAPLGPWRAAGNDRRHQPRSG